jgi:hypothetical protein
MAVAIALVVLVWKNAAKKVYVLFTLPFILLLGYFAIARLETKIDEQGIHFRMYPVQQREMLVEWWEVQDIDIRGRIGSYHNSYYVHPAEIYSMDDQYGVYVFLKSGKKVVIGTRKPNEVRVALKDYGNIR